MTGTTCSQARFRRAIQPAPTVPADQTRVARVK